MWRSGGGERGRGGERGAGLLFESTVESSFFLSNISLSSILLDLLIVPDSV